MDSKPKNYILAVDDSITNCDIIIDSLGKNYRISVATTGEQALELLKKSRPDLILLDIILPGISGYDLCRKLKNSDLYKDIPIIFLTVLTNQDQVVRGFETGAEDYIMKPFNVKELQARVKLHMEIKNSRDLILERNKEQRELIHILCHDLANTLTSISAYTSLLKDLPENQTKYVKNLKSSVTNGCNIINMVRKIDLSLDKKILLSSINLKECIDKSLEILKSQLEDKNINVNIQVESDIDIYAEPVSIVNSVLNNILTNAIKFSYRGSEIKIVQHIDNKKILLTIEDNGIGIPANNLNNLFDMNYQSRKGTEGETGTGFGMLMIKKFMNIYKGKVGVSSTSINDDMVNHGTSITLIFNKEGECE